MLDRTPDRDWSSWVTATPHVDDHEDQRRAQKRKFHEECNHLQWNHIGDITLQSVEQAACEKETHKEGAHTHSTDAPKKSMNA